MTRYFVTIGLHFSTTASVLVLVLLLVLLDE